MEATDEEKAQSSLWGFNPESRRYVLRQGSTWRKLIIRGAVKDPEMEKRWTDNREALRQRQIEAAKAARILGFGIGGGVCKVSSERKVPAAQALESAALKDEPGRFSPALKDVEAKLPTQPPTPKDNSRDTLKKLVLEHRDMLSRENLSREEAEDFLRSKLAEKGLAAKSVTVGQALQPPPKRASRWAT